MIRNTELKTVEVEVPKTTATNIGGQVPAGMKRWITFLSLDSLIIDGGASNFGVYFASVGVSNASAGNIMATGNRKALAFLRAVKTTGMRKAPLTIPKNPSIDNPLFSIAAENWLGAYITKTTALVTMQYFEE